MQRAVGGDWEVHDRGREDERGCAEPVEQGAQHQLHRESGDGLREEELQGLLQTACLECRGLRLHGRTPRLHLPAQEKGKEAPRHPAAVSRGTVIALLQLRAHHQLPQERADHRALLGQTRRGSVLPVC